MDGSTAGLIKTKIFASGALVLMTTSPKTPSVNKTGYIFKLHGNAVYSNGDQVELNYLPPKLTN